MFISHAYAQEAAVQAQGAAGQAGPAGQMSSLIFFVVLLAIFWLLIWRPQSKRNKEHAALVAGLQVGDEVVTHAGIAGCVVKIGQSNYLTLEIARVKDQPVEILIQKAAVSIVLPKGSLAAL